MRRFRLLKMRRPRLLTVVLIVIIVGLSIALTYSVIAGLIFAGPSPIGRVTFQSGDITLAGNLWIPAGDGPFPAVVIAHGSGKVTSEDYKFLRFFFVHHGFATLTYDKRGVGESGGSYSMWVSNNRNGEAVLEDLANDALAGVEFLKGYDQIDPNRIGLFGLSQGGWIAPLAASKSSDVAFIVLYSGPVCTVGQEMYYSGTTGDDPGGKVEGISLKQASDMARDYEGPHGFDPLPSLEAIDIPGLWMFGSHDRSIPTALSVENLDTLVAQQGKDFNYIIYPNADHNLIDVDTEQLFPAMSDASDWIIEKVGD